MIVVHLSCALFELPCRMNVGISRLSFSLYISQSFNTKANHKGKIDESSAFVAQRVGIPACCFSLHRHSWRAVAWGRDDWGRGDRVFRALLGERLRQRMIC